MDLKDIHNLKVKRIFSISSLGDSISSNPGEPLRRWGEEPGYIEVLQQRAGSLNIKRLLAKKENQISQVKEFRAFLCMVWRGKWQPTTVFLPENAMDRRSWWACMSPWGHKESVRTRRLNQTKTKPQPGKMQESELTEVTPFVCISAIEPVSCVSHPELPWGSL